MDYLEHIRPSAPPPEHPGKKPEDIVGDPVYPKEVVDELIERARQEPESVDWAMVAYQLGMTPQELKRYLPKDVVKATRPVETKEDLEAKQKEKDEKRIKELAEAITGFKKAHKEKLRRLYEPAPDQHFERALNHMRSDLGLRRAYQDILVKNNQEALEEKSQTQLKQLQDIYYGQTTFWDKTLPWKRKQIETERQQKENRLNEFKEYLSNTRALLGEPNIEIKMSDQETQISNEPAYSNVTLIDEHEHNLSSNRFFEPSKTQIKKNQLEETGQIIMNDLDHMAKRTAPERTLGGYLNNVFDWKTGQDILATYLASVFDDPEEANRFLNDPYNKNSINWAYRLKPARYEIPNELKERQKQKDLSDEEREDIGMDILVAKTKQGISSNQRANEITKKMAKIWDVTGIYPPLNLQIRVEKKAAAGVQAQVAEAA